MPANGQVLNPKGEYKDMQFEFSGDDDTWLYIDGVLVGDGGGIHNRTEIDINFADGSVTVTGLKDAVHTGSFEETKYLDDIFKAAGRYNDDEWEEIPGSAHKRFKAGTYHNFDMFYLERGGGESNLYIHYNLVSTADFTGHKAYEGFGENGRMARDQFQFEMIGLEGRYESIPDGVDENGKTKYKLVERGWTNGSESLALNQPAIMPVGGTSSGAGTVASPKKESGQVTVGDKTVNAIIYTTGVSEDGNINFGSAEISATEQDALADNHGSVYKYIIREVVPPDAVNGDGITWAAASEEQKKAGGFVKDQVTYDGTIYYMAAGVTSWQQTASDGSTHTEYGLRKTYYTDETFTTVADDISFVSFINTKAGMKFGNAEFTKTDALDHPLEGAEFTLYKEEECTTVETNRSGKRMVVTSGADGVISFDNMPLGTYYMKETKAPEGYALDNTVYKVIIADPDSPSGSKIVVNGDETETPVTEITNERPGELTVVKKWQNQDGNTVNAPGKTATVHLNRRHYVESIVTEDHNVSFTFGIKMYNWSEQPTETVQTPTKTVSGDTVIIKWYDCWAESNGNNNFNYTISVGGTTIANNVWARNQLSGSNNGISYTISSIDEENKTKSKQLVLTNVNGDVVVSTLYHEPDWLRTSNDHWGIIQRGATITGSGGTVVRNLVEDASFNNNGDPDRTKTLSYPNLSVTWQLGSEKFPLKDDAGKDWLYYITEDPSSDFTLVEYSGNNNPGVANQGRITVTNQVVTGPLEITKTIKKNGIKDTAATGTFYYAVYAEAYDASADPAQTPVRTGSITVSSGGTAKATEEDLDLATYYVYELDKAYSEAGKPIVSGSSGAVKALSDGVYTVTGSGTEVTLSDASVPGTAELVNNVKTTECTVTKTWAGSTSLPDGVEVEITISASGTDDTIASLLEDSDIKTAAVTLKKGEESKTWNNLPVYDSTGAEITYSVTETKVKTADGEWTAETTPTLADVFDVSTRTSGTTTTINNTPLTGKLDVTKELKYNGETDTVEAKDFYAALFVADEKVSDVKTISVSNGSGIAEFTGLKAGVAYTLKETDAEGNPVGDGFEYNVSYENQNFTLKRGELEKTAKITNNKTETGQLTVNKSVLYNGVTDTEAGTTEEPAEFRVAIFTREGEEGSYTYTQIGDAQTIKVVAGATTEAAVFTNLVIGTTYYAFEMDGENRVESSFGVYTVINSGADFTPTRENKNGEMTVTNAQTEVGSLTVTKELKKADAAYTAIKNETFTVGIYEKVENEWIAVKDPADSNADWIKTISIGQGSSSGTAEFTPLTVGKTYRIYEVNDSGEKIESGQYHEYTVSYSETPEITIGRGDNKNQTTTVTNTLETVTASVEKKWFNGETDITEQIQNASASVRLTDGTNPVTADADGNAFTAAESITVSDGVVTLTGTAWTYTWSNLPKYNASGTAIVYTVEETAAKVGDDNLTVSEVSETSGTLPEGFLIKNTLPTVDITATKVWQDKDGNVIQATAIPHEISEEVKVTFTLLADNEPTSHTVEVNGVDETADGAVPESADYEGADWTAYFKELPKYSDNGSLITYTVQETGKWPGFEAVDSDTAESGGTIINKQLTYNLKIVKVAKGTTTGLKGAKFQLTRKLDGEDSFTRFEHDQFEEVAGENGEAAKKNGPFEVKSTDGIILTGLLPGKYQIQETKAPDGYVITLSIFEFEIKTDGTIEPTTGDGTTLVQYLEARGTDPAGFQIENEPGVALPSTGGPGSNLLYLLGSLMLALGSAGLVMRKRRRVG
ncbi:MAG: SpaA isopeptide-forming pilin-related protein [Eubacterium sp.]|nr:SpaA isopeptide-forming pilin-related protein [Eubacterium sp.]